MYLYKFKLTEREKERYWNTLRPVYVSKYEYQHNMKQRFVEPTDHTLSIYSQHSSVGINMATDYNQMNLKQSITA